MSVKVADIKLDGTEVEFYNNDINEINFKCFENMIYILISKLIKI